MNSPMRFVVARAYVGLAHAQSSGTGNGSGDGSKMGTGMGVGKNGTMAQNNFITAAVFAESKSIRTSTVILAVFNALAAFATAVSILYDCYWAPKRCKVKFKSSKFCLASIHPAEIFPLILSIGIIFQSLTFAGVQGTGLEALTTKNCGIIGQFMLPALFVVPYIQLIFGIECALRSFRRTPFPARGKYDVTICVATIVIMLIGTWIPSRVNPQPDKCFASLVWFITRFGLECVILLFVTGGLMIISALVIFIRLSTVNLIDQHQRIAASRIVYYLVVGVVSLTFVVPFFVTLIMNDADLKASMMATVVLNLSGLLNGLLHLFLRSNTATTSFAPKNSSGRPWDRQKREIRIWGPNELAFDIQLTDPLSGPRTPAKLLDRTESRTNLVGPEKDRPISMESLRSSPATRSPMRYNALQLHAVGDMRQIPSVAEALAELVAKSPKHTHVRKQSYSLFPTDPASPEKLQQPNSKPDLTSVYDVSDLQPPPSIFGGSLRPQGHKRDSSIASSATVQIGLRISHAPSPSQEDAMALPFPPTSYNPNSTRPASPLRPETQNITQPSMQPLSLTPGPPQRPRPLNTRLMPPSTSPVRESCSNKTLPPTPKAATFTPAVQRIAEPKTLLSLAVYSPEKKSPTAIEPPQPATIPKWKPLDEGPQRSNSNRPPVRRSEVDWI